MKSKEEGISEKLSQKHKRLWKSSKRPLDLSGSLALVTSVGTLVVSGMGQGQAAAGRKRAVEGERGN